MRMSDKSERYIQDQMSAEEKKAHEQSLADEEINDLAFEAGVKEGIAEANRDEIRKQVAGFEEDFKERKGIAAPRLIGIAASIALVATISYLFFFAQPDLYNDYYEAYPNYEVTILRGEDASNLKETAYLSYDNKKFNEADDLFTQFLEIQDDTAARFFRGICRMELGRFEEALTDLESVMERNAQYAEAGRWYGALCQVQLDNLDAAKLLLQELVNSEEFGGKAGQLLKDL